MAEDRTGVVARLDALEAAHKAATPGKWKVEPNGEISDGEYALVIGRGSVDCMAYCYGGTSTFEGENLPADAAAIVAEHNAMPALLAVVRGVLAMDDEKTTRDLARAWLRHQGYTDEWIAVGEQQTHQSAGCEFDTNCMTWMCCDSLDCSLHPEMDSVEEAGYFARFAVDFLAEQTRATVATALGEA